MRQINLINKLFYDCCREAFTDSGLANLFISVEPIQIAFKKKIEEKVKKQEIKLLELASGANTERWQTITGEKTKKCWNVTLSDFSNNSLPFIQKLNKPGYKFSKKTLSLLNPFKAVDEKEKYDVVLATYAFDSIWFDEDLHLEKKNGKWYKASYELIMKNKRLHDFVDTYLKHGKCERKIKMQEFRDIEIVKQINNFDMTSIDYGQEIVNRYFDVENIQINYPGGLIKKVDEAFEKIIAKGGVFIIGDIAVTDKTGYIKSDNENYPNIYMDDYRTVGKVAKCKVEDYGLARIIFERIGYKVELKNIMDFVEEAGQVTPINITDHFVMTLSYT